MKVAIGIKKFLKLVKITFLGAVNDQENINQQKGAFTNYVDRI